MHLRRCNLRACISGFENLPCVFAGRAISVCGFVVAALYLSLLLCSFSFFFARGGVRLYEAARRQISVFRFAESRFVTSVPLFQNEQCQGSISQNGKIGVFGGSCSLFRGFPTDRPTDWDFGRKCGGHHLWDFARPTRCLLTASPEINAALAAPRSTKDPYVLRISPLKASKGHWLP